jgi:hypothetical protein
VGAGRWHVSYRGFDQCAKAVIPSTMSHCQPISYSKTINRQRDLIERMFAPPLAAQ